MGIGGFHLADADTFSLTNFNRQYGASLSSIGRPKTEVMQEIARDINPEMRLKLWNEFISEKNAEEFLSGCQLMVDSVDAYAIQARRILYRQAAKMGIPILAAGPVGLSCALLIFTPDSMSFDEYFGYSDSLSEKAGFFSYILGVTPRPHFLRYLDTRKIDFAEKAGPSCAAAVMLCAGVVGAEALRFLLYRGPLRAVPHYHYYDPYLGTFRRGFLRGGARNPIQRMKLALLLRKVGAV
jgi:hypothetical protein